MTAPSDPESCKRCGYRLMPSTAGVRCPECGSTERWTSSSRHLWARGVTRPVRIATAVVGCVVTLITVEVLHSAAGRASWGVVGFSACSALPALVAVAIVWFSSPSLVSRSTSPFLWATASLGFAAGALGAMAFAYLTYSPPAPGAPGFSTAGIAFVFFPFFALAFGCAGAAAGAIVGLTVRAFCAGPA